MVNLLISQLRSLMDREVDMAALAWLLIPLMAAVGAGMWSSWTARQRMTGDISELAGYARFREAMERAKSQGSVPEEPDLSGQSGRGPAEMERLVHSEPRTDVA